METDNKTFHGLWAEPHRGAASIDQMAQLGYNTLRVPYSDDALKPGAHRHRASTTTPTRTWSGLSPLQILDKVIDYAGSKGMRIILDRHRPTAAGQTAALVHRGASPRRAWITDWQMLAQRYAGNTDGHRRRPAQRAARRGHRPERAPAPAGAAATPPATGGWPPSAPATRSCRPTRTG